MTLYGGRIPDEDGLEMIEPVMVEGFGALPIATETFGALELNEAANDNVAVAPQAARIGNFMQTYSGLKYWPLDPRAEEVNLTDIAHALSLQCRYAGHAILFYSVAEHSVHITRWMRKLYGPTMALHGLLRDATEAYCVDVPRPLKPFLANYKEIEQRNWLAIAERFGLSPTIPSEVHEADTRIIGDELVNMRPMAWHHRYNEPLGVKIGCWSPRDAEVEFLAAFEALRGAAVRVGERAERKIA